MVKKIFYILSAVLLLAYILFGIFSPKEQFDKIPCKEVQIVIADTLDRHFISDKEISSMIRNAGLYPKGKKMSEINTDLIEKKIEENKLIKDAQAYKTQSGIVKIEITQKIPVMRVMGTSGDYYIDNEGGIMPVVSNFAAYVPLVTGYADKEFAKKNLFHLADYLQKNKFWDAQIEQIYVYPNKDIELTPRVGNHQILLGSLDGFEEKLDNLRLFYEQALDKVGWNRYSKINLKFKNQIVCTKN